MNPGVPSSVIPGRGPNLNPANRFESIRVEPDGDWLDAEFAETGSVPHPRTQFFHDASESLLVHHDSPDVATRRAGLNREATALSTAHFRRPGGTQLELL